MIRFIIFFVGAAASVVSEIFWNGKSRWTMALWGGTGMLLLRRIDLSFSCESKALLCLFGAFLLAALRIAIQILQGLSSVSIRKEDGLCFPDSPSFSYGLYRFLLIAPAYTIIEYLEARFGM